MTGPPPGPVYLALDGVEIVVRTTDGGEAEPELSGEFARVSDNTLTTNEDPDELKRVWSFTTPPLSYSEFLTLRNLLAVPGSRTASGWAITRVEGGTVPVWPKLGPIAHVENGPADFRYVVSFSFLEI
jgi:hypothetical protein